MGICRFLTSFSTELKIRAHTDGQNWQENFIQRKEVVQVRKGYSVKIDSVSRELGFLTPIVWNFLLWGSREEFDCFLLDIDYFHTNYQF